eukprot:2447639-Rhodomonas_salina.1
MRGTQIGYGATRCAVLRSAMVLPGALMALHDYSAARGPWTIAYAYLPSYLPNRNAYRLCVSASPLPICLAICLTATRIAYAYLPRLRVSA